MNRFTAFILTLLISFSFATGVKADWIVERVSSSVWASQDGADWRAVSAGETFVASTWIQTGDRGQVIFARGTDRIVFRPGTVATLESRSSNLNMKAIRGSLLLSIDPNRGGRTVVETPHLAAVVLGTVFEVNTSSNSASVRVDQGRVQVNHGGRRTVLEQGQQGVVPANATRRIDVQPARVTSLSSQGGGVGLSVGAPAALPQSAIDRTSRALSAARASANRSSDRTSRDSGNSQDQSQNTDNDTNVDGNNGNGSGNNGNGDGTNGNGNGNNGNGNGNNGNGDGTNGNGNGNNGNGNGNSGNGSGNNGNGDGTNGNGNGNNGNGNGNNGNGSGNNGNGDGTNGNGDDDDDDD